MPGRERDPDRGLVLFGEMGDRAADSGAMPVVVSWEDPDAEGVEGPAAAPVPSPSPNCVSMASGVDIYVDMW